MLIIVGVKKSFLLSSVLLLLVIIFIIATLYLSSKTQVLQQKWFSTASSNYKIMSEGIRSYESLRSFEQTTWMKSRYENAMDKFIREVKASLNPGLVLGAIQGGLLFLMFFVATLSTVFDNNISEKISSLILINGLLLQIAIPLLQFSSSYRFFIQGVSSARQLLELVDSVDDEGKISHCKRANGDGSLIRTRHVSIKYANGRIIYFKDCNIPINKIVILSGASGVGKSSLAKVISGIVEYEGGVESGYDISDVFYLHQKVDIFDVSFKENILLGKNYDEAKFNNVIADAGFSQDELISLSERTLGEGGANISGGQSQRIGIARMLYHDAKLMILDEPTAGLDDVAVDTVVQTVQNAAKGRSCVIVTHDQRVKSIGDVIVEVSSFMVGEAQ